MRDGEGSLPYFNFQWFLSNTVHLSSILSGALGQIEGHPQRFLRKLFTLIHSPRTRWNFHTAHDPLTACSCRRQGVLPNALGSTAHGLGQPRPTRSALSGLSVLGTVTQGSSCLATLGWMVQSLRD
jgi:hypothetical protein